MNTKTGTCVDCGKKIGSRSERCHSCAARAAGPARWGANNGQWKGGRTPTHTGTCADCGATIWSNSKRCNSCAQIGPENGKWKGGKFRTGDGHIKISKKGHRYADRFGYVFEHRLVAEAVLDASLLPIAAVHHVNGDRADNRPENLVVTTAGYHSTIHRRKLMLETIDPGRAIWLGGLPIESREERDGTGEAGRGEAEALRG